MGTRRGVPRVCPCGHPATDHENLRGVCLGISSYGTPCRCVYLVLYERGQNYSFEELDRQGCRKTAHERRMMRRPPPSKQYAALDEARTAKAARSRAQRGAA
jgi:hypothetical protein